MFGKPPDDAENVNDVTANPNSLECEITIPKENRRSADRIEVFKFGKIAVDESDTLKCVVVDLSENGARLRLEKPIDLPEEFSLRIEDKASVVVARLVWQRENDVGVEFIQQFI